MKIDESIMHYLRLAMLCFLFFHMQYIAAADRVTESLAWIKEHASDDDCEDSFHVVNTHVLQERLALWKAHLPNVAPFYAVKVNPDPIILETLADLGIGFDCASVLEMERILSNGVSPDRIIFAHTRKPPRSIQFANVNGVGKMTFDSIEELCKMAKDSPGSDYILRIKTDDSHSAVPLSTKFGAGMDEAVRILDYAAENNIKVCGVSFHVGSNCLNIGSYEKALYDAKYLFEYNKKCHGYSLRLLDLGGGWPGGNDTVFAAIADRVNEVLDKEFDSNAELIAEPGRFFATQTTIHAIRIIGKAIYSTDTGTRFAYFLSNGAYGSFLSKFYYSSDQVLLDSEGWVFKPLSTPLEPFRLYPTVLWGPTCDSGDKIYDSYLLPEMQTGDFLYMENGGAYNEACRTDFNNITPSKAYYLQ